jgi:glycosyltransferase involved in cell wall biosynthesis
MASFHVVAPSIMPADAVSCDALGMVKALREAGHEAYLYAENCHPSLAAQVCDVSQYKAGPARRPGETLIYHHAVGWHPGIDLCRTTLNRRIVKFHNVTPPKFYEGINTEYVGSCLHGALHTAELLRFPTALFLADSKFSALELVRLGADPKCVEVLPPFHATSTLVDTQADLEIVKDYQDDIRNILFVGRIAPNKGHIQLLEVFAYYRQHLNPRSRLHVVGAIDPRLRPYTEEVHRTIWRLGLAGSVKLTGMVSSAELKAYYLIAHAYLCTSQHEGFCVPLVEAMALKLPCIAWAVTGVASTLGPNSLSWPEMDVPLLAQSLHACIEDRSLREEIVRRQSVRYRRRFTQQGISKRFLCLLDMDWDGPPPECICKSAEGSKSKDLGASQATVAGAISSLW